MRHFIRALVLVLAVTAAALGQDVTVNRSNRTVEVTITATVDAGPEIGVLSLGYDAYGLTKDDAFAENVKAADGILHALSDAGVPKAGIQAQQLRVERVEPNDKWTAEQRAQRQFLASQTWEVRVGVDDAQAVLDIAVRSGANELTDVTWEVKNPDALGVRATAAALEQARSSALQIVSGLGGKLGELLYASNMSLIERVGTSTQTIAISPPASPGVPQLKLFPQKVVRHATVRAIFAVE